uniref:YqgF/RNase H-like domain-containing protein n=1 Tax=Trieres chinensis TaxID=1514140 RepID=A0A7S1Z7E5_TRICV|mmetsp:Transcript_19171/g.38872  ORF Transcript_19171/g.38872 Transcript_19171/m.38872 type:complete len:227 (+) Transcript_19171:278-958(+)|eukprot:CAMPEP_0183298276 /NCGR_PEP_ID=MMETSP0160_2-20130417/5346_1 /TAXON_ID=2839 ORGANISM="Odontella Sinensis, Strain Grunow 1884" /NCGR_SAMPLE_ID=MMETSP0160_2 /ASSEMBLY_ACC=CAM_ASM_000250 /LENGTH=226 /DNA_ID=CAMNT_0025460283 /DNA_START=72 /DNA_END=752 /DNA_ORIENTATION=+
MCLDINDERVGVALASHPSPNNAVHKLDSIPYMAVKAKKLAPIKRYDENDRVGFELEQIVREHRIGAFVVGWPLQPDGRPGGPCGKVLHLLDQLAERRNPFLSKARPFALWDERDIPRDLLEENLIRNAQDTEVDRWGRSSAFWKTPSHEMGNYVYRSGDQFYHKSTNDSEAAGMVLKHFMDSHWAPEDKSTEVHFNDASTACAFDHAVDEYPEEDEQLYIQSSLL